MAPNTNVRIDPKFKLAQAASEIAQKQDKPRQVSLSAARSGPYGDGEGQCQ